MPISWVKNWKVQYCLAFDENVDIHRAMEYKMFHIIQIKRFIPKEKIVVCLSTFQGPGSSDSAQVDGILKKLEMNQPASNVKSIGGGVVIDLEHNDDYGTYDLYST